MRLREVIQRLEAIPADTVFTPGFGHPHSYRGYYEQLAFEPSGCTTAGDMLAYARSAVGSVFEGYKGGEYQMGLDTKCHIASYSKTAEDDDSMWRFFDTLSIKVTGNPPPALLAGSTPEQAERLRKDAERYRWLRDKSRVFKQDPDMSGNHYWMIQANGSLRGATLDAAIDAAKSR